MNDAAVETTTIIPWTIKAISKAARDAATEAARRESLTVGQWLEKAITGYLDAGSPTIATPNRTGLTAPELADLLQGMAALATATGTPPAKADTRRAYALVDDHVRDARGMAPRPIRQAKGLLAPSRPGKPSPAAIEG